MYSSRFVRRVLSMVVLGIGVARPRSEQVLLALLLRLLVVLDRLRNLGVGLVVLVVFVLVW